MTDSHAESLSLSDAVLIDGLCDDFEAAYSGDPKPQIEDFLTRSPARLRRHSLRHLMSLEIELRRRNGEKPKPSDYYASFPGEEADILAAWVPDARTNPQGVVASEAEPHKREFSPAAHSVVLPAQFGSYELLTEIGRGGMGVVFLARQAGLNKMVALKTILAGELAAPEEVQRFYKEARDAAQLDHPHIVPVFEVGEHQGQHFYSMGYVEGHSLAEQLKSGPLAPKEIARLVQTIAAAVQYAHEKGIVHRDLKPANILLDTEGRPRITDFGLAKRLTDSGGLTATGQPIGTLEYMPPEQALGETAQPSPQADVYSLGAILYRSLTGRPPFQAASNIDTLQQVISHEPVAPRRLNPEIPLDLETICLACLEKNPARRYGTARELADELGRYLRGEPIHRRRITRLERGARWCRRNPDVAGLLSVSALLLVALVAASLTGYLQTKGALKIAKENQSKAETASKLESTSRQRAEREAYNSQISAAYQRWLAGDVVGAESLLGECVPDMRHWEWGYLKRLCHLELLTVHGLPVDRGAPPNDLAFTEDGKRIRVFYQEWDVKTGQPVIRNGAGLPAPFGFGRAMLPWDLAAEQVDAIKLFSPDNRWVVIASKINQSPPMTRPTGGAPERPNNIFGSSVVTNGMVMPAPAEGSSGKIQMPRESDVSGQIGTIPPVPHQPPATTETGKETGAGLIPPGGGFLSSLGRRESDGAAAPNVGSATNVASGQPNNMPNPAKPPTADLEERFSGISVWEVATKTRKAHMEGPASCLAFSSDSQLLAWGDDHNAVCVLDIASGTTRCTFAENKQPVYSLTFREDNSLLASVGTDRAISIWDLASSKRLAVLDDHRTLPQRLQFSHDGKTLASLGTTELRTWDIASGDLLHRIDAQNRLPSALISLGQPMGPPVPTDILDGPDIGNSQVRSVLALSRDGQKLATCDFRLIRIWDVPKQRELLTFRGHSGAILAAAFNSDGSQLVSLDSEGTLKVWDAESTREWFVRPAPMGLSDISRDGRILVMGAPSTPERAAASRDTGVFPESSSDAVEAWDTVTRKVLTRIPIRERLDQCESLALSPSGRYLVIRGNLGAQLVDCRSGKDICRIVSRNGHEYGLNPQNFLFSPDERWLAVAGHGGTSLWNLVQGRFVHRIPDWAIECFSPDSRRFACRSLERLLARQVNDHEGIPPNIGQNTKPPERRPESDIPLFQVFDVDSGKPVAAWDIRDERLGTGREGVYFSPRGDLLVAWADWGENRFWNFATGKERTLHDISGRDVSYGANGKEVAVGDFRETAYVFEPKSDRFTRQLHVDSDVNMTRLIAEDGTLTNVTDPLCLKVRYTPDQRRLATASVLGGSVRFWNTKDYRPIVNFAVNDSTTDRDPGELNFSDNLLTLSLGLGEVTVLHAIPERLASVGVRGDVIWRRELALFFLGQPDPDGEPLRTDAQFSPDGRWLAVPMSNSRYGGLTIHNAVDGRVVIQIPYTGTNAAFSPDGRYFAVTLRGRQIALWEIAQGWTVEPQHHVSIDAGNNDETQELPSTSLAFSPDGNWLAVDDGLGLWKCPELSQAVHTDLKGHACAFDQHGRIYAIRSGEKTVYGSKRPQEAVVLSHRTAAEIKNSPPPSAGAGRPFAPIPDGRETSRGVDDPDQAEQRRWEELVKSGEDEWTIADNALQILETATGKTTAVAMPGGNLLSVAPDGRWVAVASDEVNSSYYSATQNEDVTGRPPLVALDRASQKVHPLLAEKELAVVRLERSADGRYLLAWTIRGQGPVDVDDTRRKEMLLSTCTARLFDMNEYKEVNFAEDASEATSFSHDGQRLAWADSGGEVHVFDLATRATVAQMAGHSAHVNSLCFSADNRLIATASDDRTIRLWDLGEGKEVAVIPDHDGAVSWAEFNADGSRLASYALDGTLRLWDVKYLLAKPVTPKWLENPTFPNNDQVEQLLPSVGNGEGQNPTAGKVAPAEPPEKARPQAAVDSLDRKVAIAMLQQGLRILVSTEASANQESADCLWDFDGLPPGCAFVSQETELPAQAFRLVGIDAPKPLGKETIESLNGAESLRYLILRNFQGGEEIGDSLARLKALRGLSLFESGCTDEQFQCLAGLRQLESLSIQRTSVGDPSMKLIAGFANLRVLIVNDTPITDAGLESLKSLKSLESLHATGTLLKGSGFAAFESLPALHTLRLSVSRGIDDQALTVIGRLRNLRTLGLVGTRVSAQGVARLRTELPKCQLILDAKLEEQVNKLTGPAPAGDLGGSESK